MESGVLKCPEVDGLPVIPGIITLWDSAYKVGKVFSRCGPNWIKVKAPRVSMTHPRLAWIWRMRPGLYLVYCEPVNWAIFDPTNKRIALSKYVEVANDWTLVRVDGDVPAIPETKEQYIAERIDLSDKDLRDEALANLSIVISASVKGLDIIDIMWETEVVLDRRIPIENAVVSLTEYPSVSIDVDNPLLIGRIKATKIWPSVGSHIGSGGNRIDEASTKPLDTIEVR